MLIGLGLAQIGLQAGVVEPKAGGVERRGVASAHPLVEQAQRLGAQTRGAPQLGLAALRGPQVLVRMGHRRDRPARGVGHIGGGGQPGRVGHAAAQRRFAATFHQLV